MADINREELKKRYDDEEVLVIRKGDMDLTKEPIELLEKSYFIKRWESDYNPDEVEVIPYMVLTTKSGKVFCTKRIEGSNEKRLLNKLSIGIGGHINPTEYADLNNIKILPHSAYRELCEELYFNPLTLLETNNIPLSKEDLYIRLEETDVDKDHLGILAFMVIPDRLANKDYIDIKEKNTLEGQFVSTKYLLEHFEELEEWSKVAVNRLERIRQEE